MKHGSTTILRNHDKGQNSGLNLVKVHQSVQKRKIAHAKKYKLGFKSLQHPPYSPDLALSEYYLFSNLKRWLCGRCFESNERVEWETEEYFEGLTIRIIWTA